MRRVTAMDMRRYFGVLALLGGLSVPALAQNLPNHVDPSARDELPEAASVPALRFLTTSDYPPFNYRGAGGALVGFNVDLARAICEDLKAVCTIQSWPFEQIADALADNQGDAMIAGLAIDPASADRFDFSRIYLAFPARFVARKPDVGGFDPKDLVGRIVAVRAGTRHADFLKAFAPETRLETFDSEFAALAAVENGKADFYFGDALRAAFWLNQNPDCCTFAGDAYFRPDYFGEGLAVAVPAGHDTVRAAINLAIARLKRSGRLDDLYLRWFPIAFY
jgi:polar amino acid transport system substrate-binding protein